VNIEIENGFYEYGTERKTSAYILEVAGYDNWSMNTLKCEDMCT